jgi:BlaI family transcriptional regulator, penicillinase repressor
MATRNYEVTDAELAVLKLLWEHRPLTARDICAQLYPQETASDQATVQKLLQRLEAKKCVSRDRSSFAHVFAAAVTQDALVGKQLEALAERLTDGSLAPLILQAVSQQRLTAEERRQIRQLLDGKKLNRPEDRSPTD